MKPHIHHMMTVTAQRVRRIYCESGLASALGMATVTSLLLGAVVDSRLYALAATLGVGLAIGLFWPSLSVQGVTGTLQFDRERVREGERVRCCLTVRNRLPLPVWGLGLRGVSAAYQERSNEPTTDAGLGLISVSACRTQTFNWSFAAERRGVYPVQTPQFCCRFPFGVRQATRPLEITHKLIVWPRIYPAPRMPDTAGLQEREGPLLSQRSGTSGDMMGVRPWRRGDSLRRIHWAQTARHDRLIACEQQATRWPTVEVVLLLQGVPGGINSPREWAIRIAASLCEEWIKQGADITLRIWDVEGLRTIPGHRVAIHDALASLTAEIAPVDVHTKPIPWFCNSSQPVLIGMENQPEFTQASLAGHRIQLGGVSPSALRQTALHFPMLDEIPAKLSYGWRVESHAHSN